MPKVVRQREVPFTPEQIWAIGGDFSVYADWNMTHVSFPDGPPALEEGTEFRERVTIMKAAAEVRWKITVVDQPHRFELKGQSLMGIQLSAVLVLEETSSGGTRASMEAYFGGGPLIGPSGKSVALAAGRAADKSLAKLESLVEQRWSS